MKRHSLRKIMVFMLTLVMIATALPYVYEINAATKPAKPKISVKIAENSSSVTVVINKTKRADGYQVVAKLPGAKKYSEVKILELNGKKKRTLTVDNLPAGTYSFKIRGYKNLNGKKVWGKYSKVATVTIEKTSDSDISDMEQIKKYVKTNYPKLFSLYEEGLVNFSAEYEKNNLKNVYLNIGSYDFNGEKKTLEWQLLDYDEKEGKVLLLSKNILEDRAFSEWEYVDSWEESALRKWLGSEFIQNAFSAEERALILQSELENGNKFPKTEDRIFLLSESELKKYIANEKDRIGCYFNNDPGDWWLRTFGYYLDAYDEDYYMYVKMDGTTDKSCVEDDETGVRPAMYINLNYDKNALVMPSFEIIPLKEEKEITIKIEKVSNADGYRIYTKSKADKDFKEVADINQSSSENLDFSIMDLEPGNYCFRVIAYRKNGKKIVESEAAEKEVKLDAPDGIKTMTEEYKTVDAVDFVKDTYPGVSKLYDNGLIGLKGERKTDTIVMGSYKLEYGAAKNSKYTKTKKQPLEWEVLEYSADGKQALVISKYLICHKEFDSKGNLSWEDSSLRKWLNSDFYNGAFSDKEKSLIRLSTVAHEDLTLKGTDTEDHIFLISEYEAEKYYDQYGRIARFIDGVAEYWWLREANRSADYYDYFDSEDWEDYDKDAHMVVRDYGLIDDDDSGVTFSDIGVRPSFWIDLNDEIINANNLSIKKDTEPVVEKAYVLFGHSDDKASTPIEWEILEYDEENGKVLLISRYILGEQKYSSSAKKTDWEKSTLRSYLNNNFIKTTFTKEEQSLILPVNVINGDVEKGSTTEEKVYILSRSEYDKYYDVKDYKDSDSDKYRSVYSAINRAANGKPGNYWLRTTGAKKGMASEYLFYGKLYDVDVTEKSGILPVLWLKL